MLSVVSTKWIEYGLPIVIIFLSFVLFIVSFLSVQLSALLEAGAATPSMLWKASFLLFCWQVTPPILFKNRSTAKQELHFNMAVTAFALGKHSRFLKHIYKIEDMPLRQNAWLCIYHLSVCHDIPTAEKHLSALHTEPSEDGASHDETVLLAQAIYLFETNQEEQGYLLMREAKPNLFLAASKKLAEEYIKKHQRNMEGK